MQPLPNTIDLDLNRGAHELYIGDGNGRCKVLEFEHQKRPTLSIKLALKNTTVHGIFPVMIDECVSVTEI